MNDKSLLVDFWDTAGQERFNSMHPSYYHRAHACILVFDCKRKQTYQNLNSWYNELLQYRGVIPTIVIGNKIDCDVSVTKKKFQFAEKRKLPIDFTSAADGTNVVKVLIIFIIYFILIFITLLCCHRFSTKLLIWPFNLNKIPLIIPLNKFCKFLIFSLNFSIISFSFFKTIHYERNKFFNAQIFVTMRKYNFKEKEKKEK
ncbi:rab-like protein 2B [Reticulomyxa filosa]|uniref:Rab-like protein 2B n=1 Tax=Reticulomyxa filosa TaxID=46433 RepID=X6PE56_RETFI|nr:rab-like protein 2B [Reticulomyxa filosa]|eukprot:ETO35957.1 rab-like protein 2B [Reticulomyxa filosa]